MYPPQSWPTAAQPYLAPPQTAGNAFFMWTSKTSPVIKISPAFGGGDQPRRCENGMWEEANSLNVLIPSSHVLRLNFNLFEGGGVMVVVWGVRLEKGDGGRGGQ